MMENQEPARIAEEIRMLGKNLENIVRSAWNSAESSKIKHEVATAFTDAARTLEQAATEFQSSPTGQQMQSEFTDLQKRVESGELAEKARRDIVDLLQKLNVELEGASTRFTKTPPPDEPTPPSQEQP